MLTPRLSPASDLTARLADQLQEASTLRWRAVLAYREAMEQRGEVVVFARYGREIDAFIRLLGTPLGREFVVLGRESGAGVLWDAVPGADVPARIGDSVLHGDGADLDVWQVYGRYRRVATATHPDNPAEPVHVLHRIGGATPLRAAAHRAPGGTAS